LLQAYALACRQEKLPPLVLAGRIPPATRTTCDVYGTLSALGLSSDQILFPGLVAVADLPILYRAASILIFPSLMEGFGLPPAEAMAVGTPVLASNTSSLPEVVQKPECLFDPTKLNSLVEKLLSASRDEAQFVAQLPPTFTESYGINRYVKLIEDVVHRTNASPV
jgi:glycosyltransferase involved in cell wall biosynthesis